MGRKIDFIVNPTDEYYLRFFTKPWNKEMVRKLYPPRSPFKELHKTFAALWYIMWTKFRHKFFERHQPILLSEYMKNK